MESNINKRKQEDSLRNKNSLFLVFRTTIMTKQTFFLLPLIGAFLFAIATLLGGLQFPDYSHISQYISESYATGTPYGNYLRYLGFIPSGILIAIFAFGVPRFLPKSKRGYIGFFGVAIFYGIATVLVSIFPCDAGCNNAFVNPSIAQLIHNLLALLTYLITPFCLILIGTKAHHWPKGVTYAVVTLFSGILSSGFVILLFSDPFGSFIGLFQRAIEAMLLFWLMYTAFYLKKISL